jgi:hypothetical protein
MMDCSLGKKMDYNDPWHNFSVLLCFGISLDPESKHKDYTFKHITFYRKMYLYFQTANGHSQCISIYHKINDLTPDCNFFDFLGGKHIYIYIRHIRQTGYKSEIWGSNYDLLSPRSQFSPEHLTVTLNLCISFAVKVKPHIHLKLDVKLQY